jgi:hypothetical protein
MVRKLGEDKEDTISYFDHLFPLGVEEDEMAPVLYWYNTKSKYLQNVWKKFSSSHHIVKKTKLERLILKAFISSPCAQNWDLYISHKKLITDIFIISTNLCMLQTADKGGPPPVGRQANNHLLYNILCYETLPEHRIGLILWNDLGNTRRR